jgi:hypothetical protein
MKFGTWNVKGLYRVGSLTAAARELERFSGCAGGKRRGLQFFLWKRKCKSSIGNRIFVQHRRVSAVKRV